MESIWIGAAAAATIAVAAGLIVRWKKLPPLTNEQRSRLVSRIADRANLQVSDCAKIVRYFAEHPRQIDRMVKHSADAGMRIQLSAEVANAAGARITAGEVERFTLAVVHAEDDLRALRRVENKQRGGWEQ